MYSRVLSVALAIASAVRAVRFTVKSEGGNATSPYQYGIMFEDINNSGDGGVYAELIQNRAFQGDRIFPKNLDYWYPIGGASLSLSNLTDPLSEALTTSMRVTGGNSSAGDSTIGFWNEGFWGFPIVSTWTYSGSFYIHGDFKGEINVALNSNTTNQTYASAAVAVTSTSDSWTQFSYQFVPTADAPDSNNTLHFTMPSSSVGGPLDFNLLSLFPPTYNNRPNGLRIDLMEAMAGINPTFFRAPGGNNLEGNEAPFWWDWKKTLGPLENRTGFPGTWAYENTNGLGLIEYMLWAQDLAMEPILAIWAGHYLDNETIPEDELQPYVNDALDELEFLMGDTSTKWGSYRAELGYPEPFTINFVEVGNEDSLSNGTITYEAYRFQAFYDAIHEAYPDMNIMASYYDVGKVTPPSDASGDFHEYALPVQMSKQFNYFDNYTDSNPLLLGEYAILSYDMAGATEPSFEPGAPRAFFPFWYGSVAEAIFLLSGERNSDKIIGASFAPSFHNMNRWEWIPDLIAYDANPANLVLSTSYYMIQLLSSVIITENLPTTEADIGPAYWVAGRSDETGSHILKAVVYNNSDTVPFKITFEDVASGAVGQLTYLTAPFNASNTVGSNIVERHSLSVTANDQGEFSFDLPDYSVAVMEINAATAGNGTGRSTALSRRGWKGRDHWRHAISNKRSF